AHLKAGEASNQSLLEHSRVEAWRGNHARAMTLLELYKKDFGEDRNYLQDRARLLAWTEWTNGSLAIISSLLKDDPADFNARFTRGIALRNNHQPAEALALAEELRKEAPSKDTEDLYLAAWTPIRHQLGASVRFYTDADEINYLHSELFGTYSFSPATSLGARLEYDRLTAETGSGLENIDGSEDEKHQRLAIEIDHRFAPWVGARFSFGASETNENDQFPTCQRNIDLHPADGFDLRISRRYGYYLISPRAISLDIRHSHYQLDLNWRPNLRYTIVAQGAYDDFSDDNTRWSATLAPRRSILRGQHFNLDLGVRGWLFDFASDLNNGYYDPDEYESYMATAFAYWNLSRDDGVGLSAAAGVIRDNTMNSFEFSWEATLNGTFGIYRDWLLTTAISLMENQRQGANFDAQSASLTLVRRF
ncbi:MAG: hypothetical protein ABFQ82_05195, partial [Thermodesulfobacteriota bacterium]